MAIAPLMTWIGVVAAVPVCVRVKIVRKDNHGESSWT
jgi:hypothetical protein